MSDHSTSRDRRIPGRNYTNSLRVDPSIRGGSVLLPPMLEERSLPELFANNAERCAKNIFARFREIESGNVSSITWEQAAQDVLNTARHLRDIHNVVAGDRVGIFASTRYEWIIADLAILTLGAISVSLYHSLTPEEAGFILWDSKVKVVFAENTEQVEKLRAVQNRPFEIPENEKVGATTVTHTLSGIITFEKVTTVSFVRNLSYLASVMNGIFEHAERQIRELSHSISLKDVASIVYTSGTTGAPKGVIQTHGNHLAMLDSVLSSGLLGTGERVFLYLPLAHSFARLIAYAAIAPGGDLIFPAVIDRNKYKFNPTEILRDLAQSDPLIFPSVPRLFEKIMDGLTSQRGIKGKMIRWSARVSAALGSRRSPGPIARFKLRLAQRIGRKVSRAIFGDRLRFCVSGGAPISIEVIEFFHSLGVLICEGYGLTETTPAMAANIPEMLKFGTVGRLFDCNEVKIDPVDGEILVRGANVAQGYLDRPQATNEAWDAGGWFHTGDIGEIDDQGFLKITDRKKDLIVTAGGKKVPPALLEGKLKNSPLISQALVFGDRKPYLIALITLNEPSIQLQAKALGVKPGMTLPELSQDPKIFTAIEATITKVNETLASYEQVKRFRILSEDFTIESGLLTPSLKLKRKVAVDRYRSEIESLYATSKDVS